MSGTYEAGAPRVVIVELRNTTFSGARAKATSLSVGEYVSRDTSDPGLIAGFYDHLLEWNLTFNGEPVEPTAEAGKVLDVSLVLSLAVGWLKGIQRIEYDRPNQPSRNPEAASNGLAQGVELSTL